MTILHHIDDDILLEYATGAMAEGFALAVATHLALCPSCRARYAIIEAAGGAALEAIEPDEIGEQSWRSLKARLGNEERSQRPLKQPVFGNDLTLPEPLRSYVGSDIDTIRWKSLPGASQFLLKTRDGRSQARLLRIPAGKPVPEHTHAGREMTLVLSGAFSDGAETFARGDIDVADGEVMHQPIATDDAECICLAVTEAPLKFKSWLVRAVQPMLGI